jgi:SEC-C motif
MSNVPDRNGPCPCGSGKKYKNCCINKEFVSSGKTSRSLLYIILVTIGLVVAVSAVVNKNKNPSASTMMAPASTSAPGELKPQPPGPAPEGKVWSPEHGHWHDAAAGEGVTLQGTPGNITPPSPKYTSAPQPDGPVPEGKVWSVEHGHWHNIPGYIDSKAQLKSVSVEAVKTDGQPAPEFVEGPFNDTEPAPIE